MPSTINASTSSGLVLTSDLSGNLELQSNGSTVATATSAGFNLPTNNTLNAANTFGFKNRIINGGMTFDQRNAGASVTAGNFTYTLDRWKTATSSASKYTVQQNAGSVTPPAGFTNYLGVTSSAATTVGSSDYYFLMQLIEGYNVADLDFGSASAKTVTVSFWVRSSLTGTFGGSLENNAGNRSYPFSYTISAANTWEKKSVTIAGDTTGTWLKTNGNGMYVQFSLGVGSTRQGTANAWAASDLQSVTGETQIVGTNGATWFVTGCQLEVGTQATSFDFRSFGQELTLCQRYFSTSFPYGTAPVQNSGLYTWKTTHVKSGYGTFSQIQYPVSMRITGTTITGFNGGATNNLVRSIPPGADLTVLVIDATSTTGFNIHYYAGVGDSDGDPVGWNWSASAEL
jgi:hypothetical protein